MTKRGLSVSGPCRLGGHVILETPRLASCAAARPAHTPSWGKMTWALIESSHPALRGWQRMPPRLPFAGRLRGFNIC